MSTKSKATIQYKIDITQLFKQGMAQWWERSPPTNVARDQIPAWRHMWVEFVVGSLPCSERFFSGYSGFPLSSKTNISKFQFDQESGRRRTTLWMYYLQIIIYLFISSLLPRCLKFVQVVAANIYEPLAPQAWYSFHLWRDKSRALYVKITKQRPS